MNIFNFDKVTKHLCYYSYQFVWIFQSSKALSFLKKSYFCQQEELDNTLFINAVRNLGFLLVYKQILNFTCTLNLYFNA